MGLIKTLKLHYRSPCCEKLTKHQIKLDNQRKPPFATMAKNRPFLSCLFNVIFIPNRTFLVCFGGTLGECGLAMARILARRSQAKIPMAKPNEPDMSPKRTKKERLDIYRTQIQPKWPWCRGISGQWLDIVGYQDSRVGFWLANCEFGYGKSQNEPSCETTDIEMHFPFKVIFM